MAATNQICQMDTTSLARAVAAKELSPVEVVDAVLDRLDRLDPTLHMFATVAPDQAREDGQADRGRDRRRARGRPAGRRAHRGQGPDLHQGDPHGLGLARLRRLRARRGRRRRRADQRGGRDRDRQDPGAGVRLLRHRADPAGRADRQSVEPGAHLRRLLGRAPAPRWPPGSGRSRWAATAAARSASRPASAGSTASSRRWAGCRCSRAPRTTATRRVELGVAGAHRPADPHRRRRRAGAVGHRRLRRPRPPVASAPTTSTGCARSTATCAGCGWPTARTWATPPSTRRCARSSTGPPRSSSATWAARWSGPTPAGRTPTRRCCR